MVLLLRYLSPAWRHPPFKQTSAPAEAARTQAKASQTRADFRFAKLNVSYFALLSLGKLWKKTK